MRRTIWRSLMLLLLYETVLLSATYLGIDNSHLVYQEEAMVQNEYYCISKLSTTRCQNKLLEVLNSMTQFKIMKVMKFGTPRNFPAIYGIRAIYNLWPSGLQLKLTNMMMTLDSFHRYNYMHVNNWLVTYMQSAHNWGSNSWPECAVAIAIPAGDYSAIHSGRFNLLYSLV